MNNSVMIPFFALIAIIFIALTISAHNRNKSIDVTLDVLRELKPEAEEKNTIANDALSKLYQVLISSRVGMDPGPLKDALDDHEHKEAAAKECIERFREARNNSVDAIRDGVHKQNMLYGGANDLSAIGLHNREDEFAELERLDVRLVDSTEIRIKAHTLLALMIQEQSSRDHKNNLPDDTNNPCDDK